MKDKNLKLDDNVIAHIARILQVSMLTGTDIIDHMRMIRLTSKEENLVLQEEYANVFDGSLDSMLKNAEEKKKKDE
tara:strand:- start:450 stop:677 length:228 start_codon:yes stop_codon:yes gene_type:complete